MFLSLGCKVAIQPKVGKQTPDFRVNQGEISIYVEATAVGLTSNQFHPGPNEQTLVEVEAALAESSVSRLRTYKIRPKSPLVFTPILGVTPRCCPMPFSDSPMTYSPMAMSYEERG